MHIEHFVTACEKCIETRAVHSEPLITTLTSDRPWQRLGIDLFHQKGHDYIVILDYYSQFPEVLSLGSMSATAVITTVKSCFICFGIPDIIRTDNGPQFASREFADFAKKYGFQQETSSLWYPQCNGEVECMVRTVKSLLHKSDDPHLALFFYRTTPGGTGASPTQP